MVPNLPLHTLKITFFRTDSLCGSHSITATTALFIIDILRHSHLITSLTVGQTVRNLSPSTLSRSAHAKNEI